MASQLDQPPILVKPFASSGDKNTIPEDATGTQAASLEEGFPSITSTPLSQGGIPPQRTDFNGLGYLLSSQFFYLQNGGSFTFNQDVSDAIGGYPQGAVLKYLASDGLSGYEVVSMINNNTYNFVATPSYIDGIKWKRLQNGGNSRNVGEIVQSTLPLIDAGLHLLDGSVISSGIYSEFITYIAGLYSTHPECFTTEANWQTAVTTYGVCGKFVYDSVNNTVRLPKITGFTEGTIDPTVLGDLTTAGLPNITGITRGMSGGSGAFSSSAGSGTWGGSTTTIYNNSFDASRSSAIYGNSSTVQPQSIKVLYYIVIATSVKTEIEVDIDEIATDLNNALNQYKYDGQWVNSYVRLANNVTAPTSTDLEFDLSSYLPNDGYDYECIFYALGTTAAAANSYSIVSIYTDITHVVMVCYTRVASGSSNAIRTSGNAILPVGTGRKVSIEAQSTNTGTVSLYVSGYRRIGTNS